MNIIEPPQPRNISEVKQIIKDAYLTPGSESQNRKMLIEGLEHIKNRVEYNTKLKEAGDYHIKTEDLGGGWISHFVRDTMGGQIDAITQTIVWTIDNKKIIFNPSSGTVEYAEHIE
jgi:hypothetical protein